MKKFFKIILVIFVIYFICGIGFILIMNAKEKNKQYLADLSFYQIQKKCYECFSGIQKENCPIISRYSIIKNYPDHEVSQPGVSYGYSGPECEVSEAYNGERIEGEYKGIAPSENYWSNLFKHYQDGIKSYVFITIFAPLMILTGTAM